MSEEARREKEKQPRWKPRPSVGIVRERDRERKRCEEDIEPPGRVRGQLSEQS